LKTSEVGIVTEATVRKQQVYSVLAVKGSECRSVGL